MAERLKPRQDVVSQPTALPTNKWLVYSGGILVGLLTQAITTHFVPDLLPDQFWSLLPAFIGGVAAYIVKDQRNA